MFLTFKCIESRPWTDWRREAPDFMLDSSVRPQPVTIPDTPAPYTSLCLGMMMHSGRIKVELCVKMSQPRD